MTVLTTSAVGGEVSSSQARKTRGNQAPAPLHCGGNPDHTHRLLVFRPRMPHQRLRRRREIHRRIDDILIALVFFAIAAALKIVEKRLRAREDFPRNC